MDREALYDVLKNLDGGDVPPEYVEVVRFGFAGLRYCLSGMAYACIGLPEGAYDISYELRELAMIRAVQSAHDAVLRSVAALALQRGRERGAAAD